MIKAWKPHPIEFPNLTHGYSLASKYYKCREIKGIKHYKITVRGLWKMEEGKLIKECHNFLVYLNGWGLKKVTDNKFENGDIK